MSNLTRCAVLRGSTVAAAAAAVSTMPALAASLPDTTAQPSKVATMFAEWQAVRADLHVYDSCTDAIIAKMPLELRCGTDSAYSAPLYSPPMFGKRRDEWMNANYPADSDDRMDAYSDALLGHERAIAATPAASVADIVVKLRLQAITNDLIEEDEILNDEAYSDDGDLVSHLLLSALRDMERLAAKGGAA
jgi:hypothetical protein